MMFKDLSDHELKKLHQKLESGLYHVTDYYGSHDMVKDFTDLLWISHTERCNREAYGR